MVEPEGERIAVSEEEENDSQDVLRDVHEHMAQLKQQRRNNGDDDPDIPVMPEDVGTSVLKYHKSAEVSGTLGIKFDPNVAYFGSHVVNSNTKRIDNLRHLGELDSTNIVRHIPYLRQRGTDTKIRSTSEFQMCRSNAEIGGFDQKMGRTSITKEDVDLRQQQTVNKGGEKKSGGILGFLHVGKKT